MRERSTPETDTETMRDEYDHVDTDFGPFAPSDTVPADFARCLERERDEAREKAERYRLEANAMMMQRDELIEHLESEKSTRNAIIEKLGKAIKERDEALNKLRLEKLTTITQKEEIKILRKQLIEARNK